MSDNAFRDKIATVDESGGRVWVYPKKPKGKLFNYRQVVAYSLLVFFFLAPFVEIKGEPLLLFNFLERKFVIFGQVFGPQDFHLFVIAMISFIVFVLLFTVIYGRIWCGWACPQTVFMEMVFRRIEFFFEGDGLTQRRNEKNGLTFNMAVRKGLKHLVFLLIASVISHVFLAYLVGKERVLELIQDGPAQHQASFMAMLLFTFAFYGVFSWLREQACTLICPYGRLQGVLLDTNSIVVAYDYNRGEPRGKLRKNENREAVNKGDCIDCLNCVNVCPTGIDIRNGTQLECVNCTACIDACNSVMLRVKKPKGLIRYASETEIASGKKVGFTTRMAAYTAVLGVLLVLFTSLVFMRGSIEVTLVHVPGQLYQEVGADSLSNFYKASIMNKTNDVFPVTFKLLDHEHGSIKHVGTDFVLHPHESTQTVFFIVFPKQQIPEPDEKITVGIYSDEGLIQKRQVKFINKKE